MWLARGFIWLYPGEILMKFIDWLWTTFFLIVVSMIAFPVFADEPKNLRPIPESNWYYHMVPIEIIPEICAAFVKLDKGHTPIACSFRNYITNECHIYFSPMSLYAQRHEEKHCQGFDD